LATRNNEKNIKWYEPDKKLILNSMVDFMPYKSV